MISEQIIKHFNGIVERIRDDYNNSSAPLSVIAAMVKRAIERNIAAGGMWDGDESNIGLFSGGSTKWQPLSPNTERAYLWKGLETNPTLNRTKGLIASIDVRPVGDKIVISSSKPYAAIHQFGGIIDHPGGTSYGYKTEKDAIYGKIQFLKSGSGYMEVGVTGPHEIEIPARPYITLTEQDLEEILEELLKGV